MVIRGFASDQRGMSSKSTFDSLSTDFSRQGLSFCVAPFEVGFCRPVPRHCFRATLRVALCNGLVPTATAGFPPAGGAGQAPAKGTGSQRRSASLATRPQALQMKRGALASVPMARMSMRHGQHAKAHIFWLWSFAIGAWSRLPINRVNISKRYRSSLSKGRQQNNSTRR